MLLDIVVRAGQLTGHLTSTLKYRRFPSYLLSAFLLFPFHLFLPGAPYRIFLLFLPFLPCHFYIGVIEQQHILDKMSEGFS